MSTLDGAKREDFRVKGWHVAVWVVAFFTVVIGVDTTFTVLALRSHPGEVSVTPYEDGLMYNRRLDQLAAQARLGWRASAVAGPQVVTFEVRDREGRAVRELAMNGKLERPATEAGRLTARFQEVAPGRYVAPTGPISGTWDLTVEARSPEGAVFTAERRLTWP